MLLRWPPCCIPNDSTLAIPTRGIFTHELPTVRQSGKVICVRVVKERRRFSGYLLLFTST
jgi:hypothetical protein